ncbi:aminotransferase class IV [Bdellovibrio svalbardensis]|uniref:Aminotransferase class IV n=1 Tax=Bdellovibrio svalbardensis TaxID=2972972 RepID=A0ABT6DKC5_9BACT|nr:aminotransferase class IV [Bdellovibrio svalbardensis]MDG0817319.1 aminotransferase class IV [Bdellovibrio svalbardensis]
MSIVVLSPEQVQKKLLERSYPAQEQYYAMYSTWWGGVIENPSMMMVPIDDHIVHRGDGVFEAIKVVDGKVFLLDEHLQRLASSAEQISLPLPMELSEMRKVILETTAITKQSSAILRLYISRGPGGFTTNPYESLSSQMYLVVTALKPMAEEKYVSGVSVGKSAIPPKDPWFARIKSCNYLQNVLMKKESVDRKIDFTVGFDAQNILTESSTENIVLLDKNNNLVRPKLGQILKGTTMMRTFELAKKLVEDKTIASIQERDLSEEDIRSAKEVMMIGTTLDVLPVSSFEGMKIGEGRQGPVAKKLLALLREDIKSGPKATPV